MKCGTDRSPSMLGRAWLTCLTTLSVGLSTHLAAAQDSDPTLAAAPEPNSDPTLATAPEPKLDPERESASERVPAPEFDPEPESPPLERPDRKVLLGADGGFSLLTTRHRSGVSYEPGLAWGGHARLELRPWIGLRLFARNAIHGVDVARGALNPADSSALDGVSLDHPPLNIWMLGAHVEPTWVVTPRARLWAGIGAGWAHITTEEIEGRLDDCTQYCNLETAKRRGAAVQLSGAAGGTYDVVPHVVAASLMLTGGGFVGKPTGSLFDQSHPMQGFAGGSMLHVKALPELGASFTILASLSLILE